MTENKIKYSYRRKVYYYETDKMGFVHHSNHIRWIEEARLDYIEQAGVSYWELEEAGILMPVTGVSCRYREPARFGREVEIHPHLVLSNGVRAVFEYEITDAESGALFGEAESYHCYIDAQTGRPLNLKHKAAWFYEASLKLLEESKHKGWR